MMKFIIKELWLYAFYNLAFLNTKYARKLFKKEMA